MIDNCKRNNLYKARTKVKKIARANFNKGDKFVTLTFSNNNDFDIRDISDCNQKYSLFIRRLARRYPDLKYLTVLEFQKRGAVHYHILCNIDYIKKSDLAKIWGHGFVQINQVKSSTHIVRYISKYMMKYADDPRFVGRQRYFSSNGLERPKKLNAAVSDLFLDLVRGSQLRPISSWKYPSRYHGLIVVELYNLLDLSSYFDTS